MTTNEHIFAQTCSERMAQFDIEAFKRDFPSLYDAIILSMNIAVIRSERERAKSILPNGGITTF